MSYNEANFFKILHVKHSISKVRRQQCSLLKSAYQSLALEAVAEAAAEAVLKVLKQNCGPIHSLRWGPTWVTISTCDSHLSSSLGAASSLPENGSVAGEDFLAALA